MKKSNKNTRRRSGILVFAGIALLLVLLIGVSSWVWLQSPPGLQHRHEQEAKMFINLTEADAKARASEKGYEFRVVSRDNSQDTEQKNSEKEIAEGNDSDFRPSRVNVSVADGIVVRAEFDVVPDNCGSLCWWVE